MNSLWHDGAMTHVLGILSDNGLSFSDKHEKNNKLYFFFKTLRQIFSTHDAIIEVTNYIYNAIDDEKCLRVFLDLVHFNAIDLILQ